MIDLSKLPPPEFIDALSYEQIYAERKAALIHYWPSNERAAITELLELESEPLVKLLQENAYRELILRQRINDAGRSNLAAHASGSNLDNLLALLSVERKDKESDEDFLARALLAPQAFSTAGPSNAYKYHALSAHPDVLDVAVDRPVSGTVRVCVLSRSGRGKPTSIILDAVQATLTADDIRPLNDTVVVEAAELQLYQVHARLLIPTGAASEPIQHSALLATELYTKEQHRLSGEVRFSGLYAALHQPGVRSVDLTVPVSEILGSPRVAPVCTGIHIQVAYDA